MHARLEHNKNYYKLFNWSFSSKSLLDRRSKAKSLVTLGDYKTFQVATLWKKHHSPDHFSACLSWGAQRQTESHNVADAKCAALNIAFLNCIWSRCHFQYYITSLKLVAETV